MNKFDLSILMPGIRPQNWERAYNSILKSTDRLFELIIVSPYPLPESLKGITNIKYIRDFGSPMRCYQLASLLSEARYLFPTMADDAVFIEGAIDQNLNHLESMGPSFKNCVVAKYSESQNFSHPDRYQNDDYYKLIYAYPVDTRFVSSEWWIFNTVFLTREYFEFLGGFDCGFQAACMGFADLAVRAQFDNARVEMSNFPILRCDHIPSGGDHTPIEISQTYFDTPILSNRYCRPIDGKLIRIDHNNWRKSESIWTQRFKK